MNKFEQDKQKVRRIVSELLEIGDYVEASIDRDGGYIEVGDTTYYFDENQNLIKTGLSI